MLTDSERRLIEDVESEQADFYAPLMALCLIRFYDQQIVHSILDTTHIRRIVLSAYEDLQQDEE